MNKHDIATLLSFIAALDGREIDMAIAQAWHDTLDGVDLTLSQAKDNVIRFHREGNTRRIQPGDVINVDRRTPEEKSEAALNYRHRDPFGERRWWQAEHPDGTGEEFAQWYRSTEPGTDVVKR